MTGQPTHTPRGAFDSFQGLQVALNLGLNLRKRSPRHHNKKHSRGAPQGAKTKDKTSIKDSVDINTSIKDSVDINTSIKDSVDINDNTRLKQTMQDSDWPTIFPFVIDDNWQQAPPQGELPLTRTSLPLNISPSLASMAKGNWLEEAGCGSWSWWRWYSVNRSRDLLMLELVMSRLSTQLVPIHLLK